MEILKQKIQEWLIFHYSSSKRFDFNRVMGKTWEKVMKKQSKIPIVDIEIVLPLNFFGTSITLYDNSHFQACNIGITFQATFEEPDNKNADEKGLVNKFGWCKGTIKGDYFFSDSLFDLISTKPVEFKYEEMPEWVDKENHFDIGDWLDYFLRYKFTLSLSIVKWFNTSVKTAQNWIEERIVQKTFIEKKNDFFRRYKHVNIAEKMFP